MKIYREFNPEKFMELNEERRLNPNYKLTVYVYSSQKRQVKWELTDQQAIEFFNGSCFYCGHECSSTNLNGIDRVDNYIGYNIDNCVSCCKMCNHMKSDGDLLDFICRLEHILTYNKKIDGNLFPESFFDKISQSYKKYISGAEKRKKSFNITIDDYKKIISQSCYICGKANSQTHQNGIDRFDNNIGYIKDNCRSCCSVCNYLKCDYTFDDFINKASEIYQNNRTDEIIEEILNPAI
jgi:hypothetical protein